MSPLSLIFWTPEGAVLKPDACSIEKGTEGFSTAQKLDKLGMRGSNTCEVRIMHIKRSIVSDR